MAADLNDDLVLEIVSWLSAKKVAQSKCLNKYMYEYISDPRFAQKRFIQFNQITDHGHHVVKTFSHCSAYDSPGFTIIYLNTPSSPSDVPNGRITYSCQKIVVVASCKGLLLLFVRNMNSFYVFNPNTRGIAYMLLHNISGWRRGPPGLVVNDVEGKYSCHSLKLVEVFCRRFYYDDVVKIRVIVPSEIGCSMYIKSSSDFVCQGFGGFFANSSITIKSAYLDGYLHWLGRNGLKILVFNVEEEKVSRIINGPTAVIANADSGFPLGVHHAWFGVAQGSLSFVFFLNKEIAILGYDYVNDNWQIQHKLHDQSCYFKESILYVFPVFYDGQRLFFQLTISNKHGGIHMLDFASKNGWIHTGIWRSTRQIFLQFSPTLAKVSNEFLQTHFHTEIGAIRLVIDDLLKLQNLLLGH